MKKQQKIDFVKNLETDLKTATSVILVDHTGLSVKKQQELKKRLKEIGANLAVVKNTLFKLAGQNANVPEDAVNDTVLSGPTAMVITQADPISPLQVLAKFARENQIPQFKVGIIEGSFQNKNQLDVLSKLPGKSALYAQTIGTIAQPLNAIVYTLQAKMQDLISIIKQASEKQK